MRTIFSTGASALVAAALWLVLPAASQAQNLIANGGFETGTLGGWSTAGDSSFIGVAQNIGHSGNWAAFAGPDPSGSLLQTVATTPGLSYVVSFWLRLDDSAQPNSFSFSWNNSAPSQPFNNVAAFDYTRFSSTVVATGAASILRFDFVNPQSFWLLDDVSVTAVPEPATAALLAGGLLAVLLVGAAGRRRRRSARITATTVAIGALAASSAAFAIDPPSITVLSGRADQVSGGNALVEVKWAVNARTTAAKFALNGIPLPAGTIAQRADGRFIGLVAGLRTGANVLSVRVPGAGSQLVITNHPKGGPVLISEQPQPYICATPAPTPQVGNTPASNASGLSTAAIDAQCTIATEFKLFYRTTVAGCSTAIPDPSPPAVANPNNCFKPYLPGTIYTDLATTTTDTGQTVPYVVRVERGTINRGIYDLAVLIDPTQPWNIYSPQAGWNGKVVYNFGASTGQPRLQNRSSQNWADDKALSRGYIVADNSLSDSSSNSNRVINAETILMMKEHVRKTYGEIRATLGSGCSGGSIGQNTAASIYPGLLDGIQPSCDYVDSITTGIEVSDCVLLVNFYASPEWAAAMAGLTQEQINAKKGAINGHLDQRGCHSWNNAFGFNNRPGNYVRTLVSNEVTGALTTETTPRNNCLLPAALVYDPVTNPTGTRCGDPDLATMVWGSTANELAPKAQRALQTTDNTGVQYGLKALLSGAITAEEFVTLNEGIGGTDADSNRRAARSVADAGALPIAYRAGIVSSGDRLGKLPIIDSRGWDDQGIHHIWRSFSERARIADANGGNAANQVMWRYGTGLLPGTAAQVQAVTVQSLVTMGAWVDALSLSAPKPSINAVRTQAQVLAAKPTSARDLCYLTGDTNFANPVYDFAVCDADPRLAKHESPRQVAGGPLVENILKCQLKPLDVGGYKGVSFTLAQQGRLQAAFVSGVCDWSQPGMGQQASLSPLTFESGPGGVQLTPAPVSQPIP